MISWSALQGTSYSPEKLRTTPGYGIHHQPLTSGVLRQCGARNLFRVPVNSQIKCNYIAGDQFVFYEGTRNGTGA